MSEVIAVYGGSFDPPHVAHTLVCAYVLSVHRVDRVLVVPAAQHPFDKPLAPFAQRIRMCELALRDLRRVELSSLEHELGGTSLTLRTLEALRGQRPDATLRLVIGSDLLAETPSWHRFERVVELAPLLVVPRAGYPVAGAAPALPEVSSTEIRRRLRADLDTTGLLDPEVAAYAREQRLYR
ncbi:MAG TPA: nicotinate (nicotinamide) nucleotide adenylyltransferase [Polyangiales bacterium]|nr:nicotinate (nicotinamide) nucleotide adenylyltransferase [Polyangiales bacterium]